MAVTYTNRKGVTYSLARTATKTGKARYVFVRARHGEPVEALPPGYRIGESVNGVVSLVRDTPSVIAPMEVAIVEQVVRQHPQARHYRVGVHGDDLEVYERSRPDAEAIADIFGETALRPARLQRLQDMLDRSARWTAVLRFRLADAAERTFWLERRCYLGSMDDWLPISGTQSLAELAQEVIPLLGPPVHDQNGPSLK